MGQRIHRVAGNRPGERHGALPQNRDPVGRAERFIELVSYQDGRPARGGEGSDHLQQQLRFRRGEHGGRLIQQEYSGLAGQSLDDLQPLLQRHREPAGPLVRIEWQTHALAQQPGALAHLVRHDGPAGRQGHVLSHGQRRHRREMLVHHADAQGPGNPGSGYPPRHAVDANLSGIGTYQPIGDMHQGGLAGAVLPQQRMHLPRG